MLTETVNEESLFRLRLIMLTEGSTVCEVNKYLKRKQKPRVTGWTSIAPQIKQSARTARRGDSYGSWF